MLIRDLHGLLALEGLLADEDALAEVAFPGGIDLFLALFEAVGVEPLGLAPAFGLAFDAGALVAHGLLVVAQRPRPPHGAGAGGDAGDEFGRTGWQVSEIAFGAWQLGGDWGSVDDEASIRTLHHAFDRGVNLVDTAYIYGNGHSEEVIGRALRGWSGHKIYVATKAQPVEWPAPDDEAPQMRGRYPAWYLRKMVDNALRRLQVDRIDLFQLHSWMASAFYELDWLETLNALRVAGKIGIPGLYVTEDPGGVDRAAKTGSLSLRLGLGWPLLRVQVQGQRAIGRAGLRGVAQPGRALALGARCRRFESCRSDHFLSFRSPLLAA